MHYKAEKENIACARDENGRRLSTINLSIDNSVTSDSYYDHLMEC